MGPVLPVGARLTRRVREEYRVYSDRNATMSGAKRRGQPGWIACRTPRGFHHRLFGRDESPAEPPPGELGRLGFATDCYRSGGAGRSWIEGSPGSDSAERTASSTARATASAARAPILPTRASGPLPVESANSVSPSEGVCTG